MKTIILAAGISTRMLPLTKDKPKPMLLLNGIPILQHIIDHLRKNNIKEIIITTHYLPGVIKDYFKDGKKFGIKIKYSFEKNLMETAGSIKKLESILIDDFLIIGGNDFLLDVDINNLINFHKDKKGIGTIIFKDLSGAHDLNNFGQGILDADGRLVHFVEKPKKSISNLIHTTYQIYSPKIFNFIPSDKPYSIPFDMIPNLIRNGHMIYGYETNSEFICISTKLRYEMAKKILKGGP